MRLPIVMAGVAALFLGGAAQAATGKLALIGDEFLLSNGAFTNNQTETEDLVDALDAFLGSSQYGVFSNNGSAYGSAFRDYLNNRPGDSVSDVGSIGSIGAFDTILLAGIAGNPGSPSNLSIWENYIDAGGNVVIMLGTGEFGSASVEASRWNLLTSQYGLTGGSAWFDTAGLVTKTTTSGTFAPTVGSFTWGFGQSVTATGDAQIALAADFAAGTNIGTIGIVGPAPVPLPASGMMLIAGLASLAGGRALRKRRAGA